MKRTIPFARLALVLSLSFAGISYAQVAGSTTTTLGVSVVENTEIAMGWSVKKNLMGKTVFNEQGVRIGRVDDLIISPDKRVSYVIVGAGGFVGIGRHDVAVPIAQLQDSTGRLVIAGATKATLKALPAFDYANDTARREQFIAAADKDVAQAKAAIAELEKKAASATAETKARLNEQIAALKDQVKAAESKLAELKAASVKRWHEFEAAVKAATARLRDSLKSSAS
ncbi:photosystem reaction center protein H [Rhodoferax lacus]|uniref:Photosystem reaction center protein H n=1 Tax=Rhodoferax lacus TaxID=2184758 RepID=A0A3E1RCC0_9BURK|nr:PRC-barrel domain-containing protein [Rhodoferax lacus]RFO96913.1 photosystem reaction center protein H [Rhodoferax lacus]